MKKLIFGLALLLVSMVSLFVLTNETNDVTEDNNDSYVTECSKNDKYFEEERDGAPGEGVDLI